MNKTEKDILAELADCSGEIDDSQYTIEQRQVLLKLMRKRPQLVALRWVICPEGRKALMEAVINGDSQV